MPKPLIKSAASTKPNPLFMNSIASYLLEMENEKAIYRHNTGGQSTVNLYAAMYGDEEFTKLFDKKSTDILRENAMIDANEFLENVMVEIAGVPFKSETYASKERNDDDNRQYETLCPINVLWKNDDDKDISKKFGLKLNFEDAKSLLTDASEDESWIASEKFAFSTLLKNDTIDKNYVLFRVK